MSLGGSQRKTAEKRVRRATHVEWFYGYLFVAPVMIGVLVFSLGPIFFSFAMSLTEWNGYTTPAWIGLKNFTSLFQDAKVQREWINTLLYAVGTVPVGLVLCLVVASLLHVKTRLTGLFRVLYFLPNVTMTAAVAMVWKYLLNSEFGLVNRSLRMLGIAGPRWLTSPDYIMISMIIVTLWSATGYYSLILLAGLQGISTSYYEAARIDGASAWRQFTSITLPLLSPSIFFILIISTTSVLRVFDLVYMFSGSHGLAGGPLLNASRTVVYGIYENAFSYLKMGYASAQSVLLFLVIAALTLFQFAMQKRWVFYE